MTQWNPNPKDTASLGDQRALHSESDQLPDGGIPGADAASPETSEADIERTVEALTNLLPLLRQLRDRRPAT